MTKLSDLLVSTETFASDIQQDLLSSSKYSRCFWDDFKNEDDVSDTNMTFTNAGYSFEAGQSITSISLTAFDPEMAGYNIAECYIHFDYEDSGTALLRATADGGANWEAVNNDSVHYFANIGDSLHIRFVSGGSGILRSWSVLYKPDSGSYIQEMLSVLSGGNIVLPYTKLEANPANLAASGFILDEVVDANPIGFGALLQYNNSGNLEPVDPTSETTMPVRVMALEAGTGLRRVLLSGIVRDDSWSWTPNKSLFASTGGAISESPSTTTGDINQIIGFAKTSTIIVFDPSKVTSEVK